MIGFAEAIVERITITRRPYAVWVRRNRVTYCPDDSVLAANLRGNPESAALEIGVFSPGVSVETVFQALERAQ